jgi:uncharacterized membrane protein (UPF0127 family)
MSFFIKFIIFIFVFCILFLGYFYFSDKFQSPNPELSSKKRVCYGGNCFLVEVAKTAKEQEKGLMNRTNLDQDKGMLFVFDKDGRYSFWMKNTLIPLDIIWIDSNNKIVFVSENAKPCRNIFCFGISPDLSARYVLEINAGISKKIGLKVGDKISIE